MQNLCIITDLPLEMWYFWFIQKILFFRRILRMTEVIANANNNQMFLLQKKLLILRCNINLILSNCTCGIILSMPQVILLSWSFMKTIGMLPRTGLETFLRKALWQRESNLWRKRAYREKEFSLNAKEVEKGNVFLKGSVMECTALHS